MLQVNKKYLSIAKDICNKLRDVNIPCGIKWISLRESIYIKLGIDKYDAYCGLRISDHDGKYLQKYNLRLDFKQSKKEIIKNKEYLLYCLNDIDGLIMKIIKEIK